MQISPQGLTLGIALRSNSAEGPRNVRTALSLREFPARFDVCALISAGQDDMRILPAVLARASFSGAANGGPPPKPWQLFSGHQLPHCWASGLVSILAGDKVLFLSLSAERKPAARNSPCHHPGPLVAGSLTHFPPEGPWSQTLGLTETRCRCNGPVSLG